MRVRLKGINRVKKTLSTGEVRYYYYHRATNRPLVGEPGSDTFVASYAEAETWARERHTRGTFLSLTRAYTQSPEFRKTLAERTQKEYLRLLRAAEAEFGDMPIAALNNPRVRSHFMAWRAEVADKSGLREADNRLSAASSMLSWAFDNGRIEANHVKGFKRLYHSNRSDVIWLPEHIEAFMAAAPIEMQRALILALHTGLRQGDIRRLCWTNYDGARLTLRIGKNQRNGREAPLISIPCTATLRQMLDGMERRSALILTTKEGKRFTPRYFGHQWDAAMKAAKLSATKLRFHDLRGTAVTMLAEAGCSVPQIASITQHSLATATRILETYLAPTRQLATQAIAQFENAAATEFANRLQTRAQNAPTKAQQKG
jgi:integrase